MACPLAERAQAAASDPLRGTVAQLWNARRPISKIERLSEELASTVIDLLTEQDNLSALRVTIAHAYANVDAEIRQTMAPEVEEARAKFTDIIETRSAVRGSLALFDRLEKLEARRAGLDDVAPEPAEQAKVSVGFSEVAAHQFSLKVEQYSKRIFPGKCLSIHKMPVIS